MKSTKWIENIYEYDKKRIFLRHIQGVERE